MAVSSATAASTTLAGRILEALQTAIVTGDLKPGDKIRVVSLSGKQLVELYQVREALEGLTCRLAADNMTDTEIAELDDLLDRHEAEVQRKDDAEYFRQEGDLDFHFRIAEGCRNELLRTALCEDHYQLMRLYRYKFSNRAGRPRRALAEHRQILDAIRDRDGELAELLMRRHIRNARETFERFFEQAAGSTSAGEASE